MNSKYVTDNGYSNKGFKISIKKTTGITVYISPKPTKKPGEKGFKPVYKRRIVERSNAQMDKCRRLHKNNEALISTSEAMIYLCFIRITVRRVSGSIKLGSRKKKI